MKKWIILAAFILTFATDALAQYPNNYELLCPSGSIPVSGPTGTSFNPSTGKYRANTCIDPFGNISANLTGTTSIAKLTTPGPSPWIDITDPSYGAKCDGVTDDTTAIKAAITAAGSGGRIFIPGVCLFSTTLGNPMNGITFEGRARPAELTSGGTSASVAPMLVYTGTATPAIGFGDTRTSGGGGTVNNTLQNLAVKYTNASFNGCLISADVETAGFQSNDIHIKDAYLSGTSTANSANLVCLDNVINITIERTTFNWYSNAIRGKNATGHFATTVRLWFNAFNGYSGTTTGTAHILNPGTQWTMIGNIFEMLGVANGFSVMDTTTSNFQGCDGCLFSGNWIGDAPVNYSGTFIKQGAGADGGNAMEISGNFFQSGSGLAGTAISLANNAVAVSVTGNDFANFANGIAFGTGNTDIFVHGNSFAGVTNRISGTPSSRSLINTNDTSHPNSFFGAFRGCNSINCSLQLLGNSDIARIYGGGTANPNGILIMASQGGTGTTGPIAIRDNDTDSHEALSVTPGAAGIINMEVATKIKDQGTATLTAGTSGAITFPSGRTYTTAPQCITTWNGTGTLTGIIKCVTSTTQLTVTSSVGTDTAVMHYAILGN